MKTLLLRLPVLVVLFTLLMPLTPLHASEGNSDAWSVAVLDQILAGVQPGQKFVQIDDMEISVDRLQAWRDQLAGVATPQSAFDGVAATLAKRQGFLLVLQQRAGKFPKGLSRCRHGLDDVCQSPFHSAHDAAQFHTRGG